jgi:hypothetical protein
LTSVWIKGRAALGWRRLSSLRCGPRRTPTHRTAPVTVSWYVANTKIRDALSSQPSWFTAAAYRSSQAQAGSVCQIYPEGDD